MDSDFFVNCNAYSDNDKEKGVIERIIVETVMCINHFDGWNKEAKKLFKYINAHGSKKEFDILEDYICRLGNVITEDINVAWLIKAAFQVKEGDVMERPRGTDSAKSDLSYRNYSVTRRRYRRR